MLQNHVSFAHILVLIKGAGDLATGVAYRLHQAGFPVVMTELAQPLAVRRTVAFSEAVYEGEVSVEGVVARRAETPGEALTIARQGLVPVLVDPGAQAIQSLQPAVVVDAIMAKRNTGTRLDDAPLVIALGPGFTAGVDCHAVIETNRGHNLGRIYWQGSAEPNTGTPGSIGGHTRDRVLRAPTAGTLRTIARIGDRVKRGQVLARVNGAAVVATFRGVLRGLLRDGFPVQPGMKIGDVDPRARPEYCYTISDKSLAIGGAVLAAIMYYLSTTPPKSAARSRDAESHSSLLRSP